MKWTGLNDLRELFLSFFETKEHLRLPSFPLVPKDDDSLLLINSGMAPMKNWFTGTETPPSPRVTTCQKCIRTPDIESVGITARHGTYFEMLGNFSFQDYFKKEAIEWAWEFFTSNEWLNLDTEKLYISVFEEDDEAYNIWRNDVGIEESHLVRLGEEHNFWQHGIGPCGPCSEIYYDRGDGYDCDNENCGPGCDCDRFMELWNLVFTEFYYDDNGGHTKLEEPNIDTGLGLERIACVMQQVDNIFEVDTVQAILHHVEKLSGKKYGDDEKQDISIRVVTDHIRSTVFMVGDGVIPSNEGRGYVLRRLLRRAARHGRMLGIENAFLADVSQTVMEQNKGAYPELQENFGYIQKTIAAEEERFLRTIDQGLSRLNELLDGVAKQQIGLDEKVLSGIEAFRLNDTFGFPFDLTKEIAAEAGVKVDEHEFNEELQKQREQARKDREGKDISGWDSNVFATLKELEPTHFTGYDSMAGSAVVQAIAVDDQLVDSANHGMGEDESVLVVLDETPFYAEGGGQVADTGLLTGEQVRLRVENVQQNPQGLFIHSCVLMDGTLKVGDTVDAAVNTKRRGAIMRNHTSVHLTQKALREVLGDHVNQAGSYVDEERMRFDFTHFSAPTSEELHKVERIVNQKIYDALPVTAHQVTIEEAREMGAIALFGEKYADVVRVIDVGEWSKELCGGTHVDNTAKLGLFKILNESSVAAGVRRIEGTTSFGVLHLIEEKEELLQQLLATLRVKSTQDLPQRLAHLLQENSDLTAELKTLQEEMAQSQAKDLLQNAQRANGVQVITQMVKDGDADALKKLSDEIKGNHSDAVAVLIGDAGGKLVLAVGNGAEAIKQGLHAGKLVKEIAAIAGGSGGGKPDFAMGGLRDAEKIEAALNAAVDIVKTHLQE